MDLVARRLAAALSLILPAAAAAQSPLGMDPGLPLAAAAATAGILESGAVPSLTALPMSVMDGFGAVPVTELSPLEDQLPDAHTFSRLVAALELGRTRAQGVVADAAGRLVLGRGPGGYLPRGIYLSRPRRENVPFDAMQLGIDAQAPQGTGYDVWFRGVDPAARASAPWTKVQREQEIHYPQAWPAWQVQVVMFTTRADQTPTFTAVIGHPALVGPIASLLGQGQSPSPAPAPAPPRKARNPEPKPRPHPHHPHPAGPPREHRIVTRAEWGAKAPSQGRTPMKPELFTIHHTASRVADYHGEASIRAIQAYHQGTHGWSDIGYHYVIGPDGRIFEGRPPTTLGAHCIPNTGKVGICLVGNFEAGDQVPAQEIDALVWLLSRLHRQLGIPLGQKLQGHRDFMQTACPGDRLYRQLPAIQARVRQSRAQ